MNLTTAEQAMEAALGQLLVLLPGLGSPELAALLASAGVTLLLAGGYHWLNPSMVRQRLRCYVLSGDKDASLTGVEPQPGSSLIGDVLERRLARRRAMVSLRMQLGRAGLPVSVGEFLLLRLASALLLGSLVGVVLASRIGTFAVVGAVAAALLGSYLPCAVVAVLGKRRMAALEAQIPDALDMLASSLQAGTGLAQGLALVSREMAPPMAEETRQVLQEVGLGLAMNDALTNLANRVDSEELDLVVTAIIIQIRVGGNLAHVLRTAANTIRERMALRGEIRVLTAQQRFSATVISLLPVGVAAILWLLNAQYMSGLLEPGIPRSLLVGATAMLLAGMFMLKKIADIEV